MSFYDYLESAGKVVANTAKFTASLVDGVPVAGHVKGSIHYAVGDDEGGKNCMKKATRQTAVLAAGVGGAVIGGPGGAAAAGIGAGSLYDRAIGEDGLSTKVFNLYEKTMRKKEDGKKRRHFPTRRRCRHCHSGVLRWPGGF